MKVDIFRWFIVLLLISLFLPDVSSPLRLVKYCLPLLAIIPYFFVARIALQYRYFAYMAGFLIFYAAVITYLLVKGAVADELQIRSFANAVFIISPLLLIFLLAPFYRKEKELHYIKLLFFGMTVIFLLEKSRSLLPILTDFESLTQALVSSTIDTENQLAFGFGLLLFYFMSEKRSWRYSLICALFFVLSFKRIALAAFAVSYGVYLLSFLLARVQRKKVLLVGAGLVLNFLFIQFVFWVVDGRFDSIVKEWTNLTTNHFLMGRQVYFQTAIESLGNFNWAGVGLGRVDTVLMKTFNQPQNLHSDVLKNYIEFGVVIFSLWIIMLYAKTTFSRQAIAMLVYFNVLMFTDNVFIYFDFMFLFYFFVIVFQSKAAVSSHRSDESAMSTS